MAVVVLDDVATDKIKKEKNIDFVGFLKTHSPEVKQYLDIEDDGFFEEVDNAEDFEEVMQIA